MKELQKINIDPIVMTSEFTARVISSKGDSQFYDVDVTGPDFCTCDGFKYRGDCRHIKEVRKSLGINREQSKEMARTGKMPTKIGFQ